MSSNRYRVTSPGRQLSKGNSWHNVLLDNVWFTFGTRRYTVCQNVNVLFIYGESSAIPSVTNSIEKQISNLRRETGYLELGSRDYRQSIHMHTRPQFRHYIRRKHCHEMNVFSTKTRRSININSQLDATTTNFYW